MARAGWLGPHMHGEQLGFILSGVRSPWTVFSRGVAWSNRGSENQTVQ